jgi:hypothetical protein
LQEILKKIVYGKFRQINDQLFAQRQTLKSIEKATLVSQQQNFEAQILTFDATLVTALNQKDKSCLLALNVEVEALFKQVTSQSPVLKSIASTLEKIKLSIAQGVSNIDKILTQQSWLNLFTLMTEKSTHQKSLEDIKVTTEFEQLTGFWQKRLVEHAKLTQKADVTLRSEKTIEIEILANVKSPIEVSDQRMAVQVKLMQQQMLSGGDIDLSKELVKWLMLGQLETTDLPLLSRLKQVFVVH